MRKHLLRCFLQKGKRGREEIEEYEACSQFFNEEASRFPFSVLICILPMVKPDNFLFYVFS